MTIEFQEVTLPFSSGKGGPLTCQSDVPFKNSVNQDKIWAAIKSFDFGFSSGDHHLKRQSIKITTTPYETNKVRVHAKFELRDDSGDYDDYYDGEIKVVVIAETGEEEVTKNPQIIHGNQKVALIAHNGKHLSASGNKLEATRNTPGDEETFKIEIVDNSVGSQLNDSSQFALCAYNGQYVCAEGSGGRELVANRGKVGPWETFTILRIRDNYDTNSYYITDGQKVALRANNGQYVCVQDDIGKDVFVSSWRVDTRETFTMIIP